VTLRTKLSTSPAGRTTTATGSAIGPHMAVWLGDRVLMLLCSVDTAGDPFELSAVTGRRSIQVDTTTIVYERAEAVGEGGSSEALLVGCADVPIQLDDLKLEIRRGPLTLIVSRGELEDITTDVRTLARNRLAVLEPEIRMRVLELLVKGSAAALQGEGRISLAKRLFHLREALRERRPTCVVSREEPQGLHVDSIHAVDDRSVWVKGWARDGDAQITALRLISAEGATAGLLPGAFRFGRPDVGEFYTGWSDRSEQSGFVAFGELPSPTLLDMGWIAEMENGLGAVAEVPAPGVARDPVAARDAILSDLAVETPIGGELTSTHAHPALSRLQARLQREVDIDSIVEHGSTPRKTAATIVIPLYGRIDFVEHQLAQFVHDPELRAADLVYVLDSPELGEQLADLAPQLHALYRIPFRVVFLTRNAGFSLANNLGASVAHGERLLFLNSDVIPDRPGWLGQMLEFHHRTPKIGALGPKLLYEDGSLQHAGLHFERTVDGVWENAHFFKGLHRAFPQANVARAVPAVTGACLMIDRKLFESVGGFSGTFVQGDCEDSDLCLRLLESGRENWYVPQPELFHLEAQSYPTELRKCTRAYNDWLQSHLWSHKLNALTGIGSSAE
jgi:GT2 family glycosyltransferase